MFFSCQGDQQQPSICELPLLGGRAAPEVCYPSLYCAAETVGSFVITAPRSTLPESSINIWISPMLQGKMIFYLDLMGTEELQHSDSSLEGVAW